MDKLFIPITKSIFYILSIYIIFLSLTSFYRVYQYNKIYNKFKSLDITHNIDFSTLKDSYILLDGKIKSTPSTFETQFIKSSNSFVYLNENREHYFSKTGWETDSTSKFYADNVSIDAIPIDLKSFNIDSSEKIKTEDIKESFKKYYNENLYFNRSNGDMDKRVTYTVLRNNTDVLIFSKVKYGKLVTLSSLSNSLIFAGDNNYIRLDSYLTEKYKENISLLVFSVLSILILLLYKSKKIFNKKSRE